MAINEDVIYIITKSHHFSSSVGRVAHVALLENSLAPIWFSRIFRKLGSEEVMKKLGKEMSGS